MEYQQQYGRSLFLKKKYACLCLCFLRLCVQLYIDALSLHLSGAFFSFCLGRIDG